MNIPNLLTAIRLLLVPLFGYFVYKGQYLTGTMIFTIAALTDVLDGAIARKYNMITKWGKVADPIADKLIQFTALIMLNIKGRIPLILVLLVISKDLFILIGSLLLYKKKHIITQANWYGKLTTVVLFAAIGAALFNLSFAPYLVYAAIAFTLFSLLMYTLKFMRLTKKERNGG